MRTMISLYLLLTSPVPVPRRLLMRAAAALLGYGALMPHQAALVSIGLHPVNLSVALALWIAILFSWSDVMARLAKDKHDKAAVITGLTIGLISQSLILLMPTLWLMHWGIPLAAVAYGSALWISLRLDPDLICSLGWTKDAWGKGRDNAVHWTILRRYSYAVALVGIALTGAELDWVIGYALIPLLLHYVYWWTIFATHPGEDEVL